MSSTSSTRTRRAPEPGSRPSPGRRCRLNLPNVITSSRILAAPVVTLLLLEPGPTPRLIAFAVFIIAAVSDLWDGYLARSRGQITSFGKIVDPLADKLLLVCTLIPLYAITAQQVDGGALPLFGSIPLWAVVIFLGRELLITTLRFVAAGRGEVVGARTIGKRKAVAQNVFVGAAILWVAFHSTGFRTPTASAWRGFSAFHGWFTTSFLIAALILTVASAVVYVGTFSRILVDRHSS